MLVFNLMELTIGERRDERQWRVKDGSDDQSCMQNFAAPKRSETYGPDAGQFALMLEFLDRNLRVRPPPCRLTFN